jgi:anti-anti-sigma factor
MPSTRVSRLQEYAPAGGARLVVGDALSAVSVSAVTVGPHASWLSAAGKLVDEIAAANLAGALEWQLAIGCRFVWLDLSEVSILDRASSDVLVEAHHRFSAVGGTLILTGVNARIARLLEVAGQDRTFLAIVSEPDPHPGRTSDVERASQAQRDDLADHETAAADLTVGAQRVIDRAVGVVMGRTYCGVVKATEQLQVLSRATGRSARQVAQSILDDSGKVPVRTADAYLRSTGLPSGRSEPGEEHATNLNDRLQPERSSHVCIG